MKKKFIEPEIKRIELNLNENIASSDAYSETIMGGVRVFVEPGTYCLKSVQHTGIPYSDYLATLENVTKEYEFGCFIAPKSEVARQFGLPITNDIY